MDRHVLPKLGGVPVDQVGTAAVHEALYPLALAGKHATLKTAGSAITAVLDWARIQEHGPRGSPWRPCAGRRRSGSRGPGTTRRCTGRTWVQLWVGSTRRSVRADEAGDPVHGADGGAAWGGAGNVGPVRPRRGGVGTAGGLDEDGAGAPGSAVAAGARGATEPVPRRRDPAFRRACIITRPPSIEPGREPGNTRPPPRAPSRASASRASRTGRGGTSWTSCCRSSRWHTWRALRRWRRTRAMTCWSGIVR